MVYYFTPYSLEGDIGKAYNQYMELVPNDDDWACFMDGDTMLLTSDFGHQIQEIINTYPGANFFTCYASRIKNKQQQFNGIISEDPNILNHRKIAIGCSKTKRTKVKRLNNLISGHLMLVKKSLWKKVKGFDEGVGILKVDNKFSSKCLKLGESIYLMEGIYLLHFYRMDTGISNRNHLKRNENNSL